jgi:hypothetical protein
VNGFRVGEVYRNIETGLELEVIDVHRTGYSFRVVEKGCYDDYRLGDRLVSAGLMPAYWKLKENVVVVRKAEDILSEWI